MAYLFPSLHGGTYEIPLPSSDVRTLLRSKLDARIASVCGMLYSDQWKYCWKSPEKFGHTPPPISQCDQYYPPLASPKNDVQLDGRGRL